MGIVTLDFETYYSQEYSLGKMSEIEYIKSPLWQTIMCTFKYDNAPTVVRIGDAAVRAELTSIDWTRNAMLSHNIRFDGSIAKWHYGVSPAMYLDTLSMARALTHSVLGKSSLKAVSDYLGLPPKGDEVVRAIGKRLENFTEAELQAYADYCVRDTDNCRAIFDIFRKVMPREELDLIDTVARMFIEPQCVLDPNVLATHLSEVRAEKALVMAKVAHLDKSVFSSNAKFAALLEECGVEVPTKISPVTGLSMPALAKNDRSFKELCSDADQPLDVQAMLAARLGSKSTLEETRTERLGKLSLLEWGAAGQGWAPVALKYYGSHTGRLSGDGGDNWQNFKRGSNIRKAIKAPPGMRVVHRDASQIEARGAGVLAGCHHLVHAFAQKRDVYSEFASDIYGKKVTKADVGLRFVGKTCILGLGYQCGGERLRHTLFIGNGGVSVVLSLEEATDIVYKYRRKFHEIKDLWDRGNLMLGQMVERSKPMSASNAVRRQLRNLNEEITYPCIEIGQDALWLPNGMAISYPNLRCDSTGEFGYDGPYKEWRKLYGGKVLEHVDQALSRIIVMRTASRVKHSTGYRPFLTTHDSLDYIVPRDEAEPFDAYLETEFAVRPDFAPSWPLASEGGWGLTLYDAEKAVNV